MPVAAIDTHAGQHGGSGGAAPNWPPEHSVGAVTPSDTDELYAVSTWICVSADCSPRVKTAGGETVVVQLFKGWNPCCVRQIFATGGTLNSATITPWW